MDSQHGWTKGGQYTEAHIIRCVYSPHLLAPAAIKIGLFRHCDAYVGTSSYAQAHWRAASVRVSFLNNRFIFGLSLEFLYRPHKLSQTSEGRRLWSSRWMPTWPTLGGKTWRLCLASYNQPTCWFKRIVPILSAMNAACNGYSNVTYFEYLLSYWPPWTVVEGNVLVASFCVQGLGLARVAKTCPRRPQAFKKVKNGQAFPNEKKVPFFIAERAVCRYSKACL